MIFLKGWGVGRCMFFLGGWVVGRGFFFILVDGRWVGDFFF